jgi:hypothetical protein
MKLEGSWTTWIQSTHPVSFVSILILPSHLHHSLPSGLFPSGSPTRTTHFSFPPRILHASLPPLFYHPSDIWWRVQIMKVLICNSTYILLVLALSYVKIITSALGPQSSLSPCSFVRRFKMLSFTLFQTGTFSYRNMSAFNRIKLRI